MPTVSCPNPGCGQKYRVDDSRLGEATVCKRCGRRFRLGDVKPANIMLDNQGQPLLMDFGLARVESVEEKLTHDGSLMGTPAYMAPEQADGSVGEVGPASDQYSLGVVLYELLCGQTPFSGPPAVLIYNALNTPPEPPRTKNPAIPRDLETICLKALAKRPAERYANCGDLADDLRRWLDDEPITAQVVRLNILQANGGPTIWEFQLFAPKKK